MQHYRPAWLSIVLLPVLVPRLGTIYSATCSTILTEGLVSSAYIRCLFLYSGYIGRTERGVLEIFTIQYNKIVSTAATFAMTVAKNNKQVN